MVVIEIVFNFDPSSHTVTQRVFYLTIPFERCSNLNALESMIVTFYPNRLPI